MGTVSLSKEDLEAINTLKQIDISKNEGKVLAYLFKVDEAFAKDIERAVDLRQPELSTASKALLERNLIKGTNVKSQGKGRPLIKYSLARSKGDTVKSINKLFSDRIHMIESDMEKFNTVFGEGQHGSK